MKVLLDNKKASVDTAGRSLKSGGETRVQRMDWQEERPSEPGSLSPVGDKQLAAHM